MSLPCDFVEGHLANVTLCAFGVCVAVSNSEMVLSTLLKCLLLCVFIVNIHIHIDCVCACVCMYACLQRLEFSHECQPPTFETESLLTWSLLVKLSWLAREPQGSTCLCFLGGGFAGMCHHSQLFMWLLGIKPRSSCL